MARTIKSAGRTPARRTRSGGGILKPKGYSMFDGANRSSYRGWFYVPTLDTSRELDSYSHWELVKRARWFYANSGFARRCVNGLAGMIGYLTPRPLTTDAAWNDLAMRNFENRAGSAQVCDLAGKHNFYSYQIALSRNDLKDGDILTALTKTANGGAAFLGYEAHQIGNSSLTDSNVWTNGVLLDRYGKHQGYRILNGMGHFDISARDAIYYGEFERLNQPRGITGFAHAINHLHDITEIRRDMKLGIKITNQMGFYRTRPGQKTSSAASRRMGAGRHLENANPNASDSKVSLEDVFRGGKVAELFEGEEIKTIQDSRPHPNQMSFLDDLVRDMSWGFGVSPEVLWFVGKINGTSNRFLLADAVKWVEQKQQRLADTFCRRYWVYHIACEMKAGRLRQCEDPEWWKVGFIPQTRLTVDRSKDGKLSIDLRKAGMITLSRYYDEQFSEDWRPPTDQWMDELAYIRDGLKKRNFENLAEVQALLGATQMSVKADPAAVTTDDDADPDADPKADPDASPDDQPTD